MTDPSVDRLLKGEPVWERMKRGSTRPVIFLPHYGEFGFFILQYIRFIHFFNARDKVVCCAPGSELYFPTAHDFFYEWTNPIPDSDRCVMACGSAPGSEEENKYRDAHLRLGERLRDEYPDHEQIEVAMVCRNPAFARLNFGLVARDLTCVDIAIGARHREWDRANNYTLWPEVWDRLLGCGFSVGVVGSPESTVPVPENVVRSWHHAHGVDAGAVAMLRGCRLYVGTDTGVSHLAAMLSTPSLIFRSPKALTDMTFMLRNATTGWFQMLGTEPWGDPDVVYNRVRDAMQAPDLDGRFSYPLLSDPNAPLSSEGDTRRSLFPTVDRSASSDVYALTAVDELSPLFCHWMVHYLRTIQVQRVFLLLADPIADEAAALALRAFGDLVTPIRCHCDRFDDVAKQQAESDLLTSGMIADNAWIIYADIDELVQFPAPLKAVTAAAQEKGIDWIGGTFVDRLSADGRLGAVRACVEWQDDFPIKCHLTSSLLSGDDRKIVLCRAWVRCFNSGHHTTVNGRGGIPIDGDYEVHHFKWTEGLVDRIKARLRNGRYSEMYLRECEIVVRTFDSGRSVDVSNLRIDGGRP